MNSILSNAAHPNPNRGFVLAGLLLGMFFGALEQTIVGTALPSIMSDLNGLSIMSWITTAYMIGSTAVIPIAGKLSDIVGRRSIYAIGWLIFLISSVLCANAETMEQLIAYRGLQGIGGGMIMPLTQIMIGDIFSPADRAKWQGAVGAVYALSSILGPLLGGIIVDYASWHWIFWMNIPFGILSTIFIFIGMATVDKNRPLVERQPIDWLGIVTFVPCLVLFLLGLSLDREQYPWNSWMTLLLFGASLIFLLGFICIEKRAVQPIISLSLFKNRVFQICTALSFLIGLSLFGAIMFVPLFMQGIVGVSPVEAGSTMTPLMIAMIITSIIGTRLLLKIRYRTLLSIGMTTCVLGFYFMSMMGVTTTISQASIAMIVLGLGIGLVMPAITVIVQNSFSKDQLGTVTSTSTFFRSIGGAIGTALFNVIMNEAIKRNMTDAINNSEPPLQTALEQTGTHSDDLYALITSPDTISGGTELHSALLTTVKSAWATSFSSVYIWAFGIAALGILLTLLIGNGRIEPHGNKSKSAEL
ncbi:MFS transporter [Paenibacillus sp. SC116]|uniref:MDR family MFS transporter n=1 Tax=Paenibacillus sp. SC116 TaxID=2968986 RepID=UPI00215B5CEE|nr:MDR family MFS transporter [Paenibacillus sp. SC116]MCR8845197.1 MFS transporter [Paenibacillus sp. SC116]